MKRSNIENKSFASGSKHRSGCWSPRRMLPIRDQLCNGWDTVRDSFQSPTRYSSEQVRSDRRGAFLAIFWVLEFNRFRKPFGFQPVIWWGCIPFYRASELPVVAFISLTNHFDGFHVHDSLFAFFFLLLENGEFVVLVCLIPATQFLFEFYQLALWRWYQWCVQFLTWMTKPESLSVSSGFGTSGFPPVVRALHVTQRVGFGLEFGRLFFFDSSYSAFQVIKLISDLLQYLLLRNFAFSFETLNAETRVLLLSLVSCSIWSRRLTTHRSGILTVPFLICFSLSANDPIFETNSCIVGLAGLKVFSLYWSAQLFELQSRLLSRQFQLWGWSLRSFSSCTCLFGTVSRQRPLRESDYALLYSLP